MKITFIDHSAFMVELERVALLFDYVGEIKLDGYQIGGQLPEFEHSKQLYVFNSHHHPDHCNGAIFEPVVSKLNPIYILADDVKEKQVPSELEEQVTFIGPNQTDTFNHELTVRTFLSTDRGVAFVVEVEGHTIYHAGDLNNWHWNGEPDEWNAAMEKNYLVELEKMREINLDLAFVPVDTRQEEWCFLGMDQFCEIVGAEKIVPMHFWEHFEVIDELIAREQASEYAQKVVKISAKQEVLDLEV